MQVRNKQLYGKGYHCKAIDDHFKARPTDIFLTGSLKSGIAWLKAIMFSTMNRSKFEFATHPMLTTGPHDCIPYLDAYICDHDVEALPSPRLFASHSTYALLPKSVRESLDCKIVYICRNPKNVFASHHLFAMKLRPPMLPPISMEQAFDLFCRGVYWKASLESRGKILFLKYEEMRKEPMKHVKQLENEGLGFQKVMICWGADDVNLGNHEVTTLAPIRSVALDSKQRWLPHMGLCCCWYADDGEVRLEFDMSNSRLKIGDAAHLEQTAMNIDKPTDFH
ncbi:Sulfotransferase domain [Dillenia turbinata]|uniref:Sulfotransferase n=1 Tax=Dillenia turbinata TaxID=194707 RepID=A0AAN8US76_9MAGN